LGRGIAAYGGLTGGVSGADPGLAAPVAEPEPAREGVGWLAEVLEPPLALLAAAGVTLSDWHAAIPSAPVAAKAIRV
jgi:hypothetical protein